MLEDLTTKEIKRTLKQLKKAYREIKKVRESLKEFRDRAQKDCYDQDIRELYAVSINMNDFYKINDIIEKSANLLKPCITRLLPANNRTITVGEILRFREQARMVRRSNSNVETWILKSHIALLKNALKHRFMD